MHIVMPKDLNTNNTLFGGTLMSWIDEQALMYAVKHFNNTCVFTKSFDISFIKPAKIHDIITFDIKLLDEKVFKGIKLEITAMCGDNVIAFADITMVSSNKCEV